MAHLESTPVRRHQTTGSWILPLIALFFVSGCGGTTRESANTNVDKGDKKVAKAKPKQVTARLAQFPLTSMSLAEVYNNHRQRPKPPAAAAVIGVLEEVRKAVISNDWRHFRQFVDVPGHIQRMIQREAQLKRSRASLTKFLTDGWEFSINHLVSVKVANVVIVPPASEENAFSYAHAYTWCEDKKGVHWRVVWLLAMDTSPTANSPKWRVQDWLICDWNHIESHTNAQYLFVSEEQRHEYREWHSDMAEFLALLGGEAPNPIKAAQTLQRAATRKVPKSVQGEVDITIGSSWELLGLYGNAAGRYQTSQAPGRLRQLCDYFFATRNYHRSIALARQYLEKMGAGPWVHGVLGDANLAVGNIAAARQHYHQALACEPQAERILFQLAQVAYSKEQIRDIRKRADSVPESRRLLIQIADQAIRNGNARLAQAMLPKLPAKAASVNDSEELERVVMLTGRLWELTGDWKKAEQHWRLADTKYGLGIRPLLEALMRRGGWQSVLNNSPDSGQAIAFVLDQMGLEGTWTEDQLNRVRAELEAFVKQHPRDPLGPYLQSTPLLTEDPSQRVVLLQRARSSVPNGHWLADSIRRELLASLLSSGKGMEAFQLANPKNSGEVANLASPLANAGQWPALTVVLDEFAKNNQGDSVVKLYRAIRHLRQQRHGQALLLLSEIKPNSLPISQRVELWNALQATHIFFGSELELLRQSKDKLDTFNRLSSALLKEEKYPAHRKLCDAFENVAGPNDLGHLLLARATNFWKTGNYEQLNQLKIVANHLNLTTLNAVDRTDLLDWTVLGLIRAGELQQALATSLHIRATYGYSYPHLLARVASPSPAAGWLQLFDESSLPRTVSTRAFAELDMHKLKGMDKVEQRYPPRIELHPDIQLQNQFEFRFSRRNQFRLERSWNELTEDQQIIVRLPVPTADCYEELTLQLLRIERPRGAAREVVARVLNTATLRFELRQGHVVSFPIELVSSFQVTKK